MAMITLEELRLGVPGASPGGEDLTAESDYIKVTRAVQQRSPGYSQLNWAGVEDDCMGLLERTRDLRLGMIWSLACLHRGLGRWKESLDTLTSWIQKPADPQSPDLWDSLHPRRLNARIVQLNQFVAEYSTGGEFIFVRTLKHIPLSDASAPASRALFDWEGGRRTEVLEAIRNGSTEFTHQLTAEIGECLDSFRQLLTAIKSRLAEEDTANHDRCANLQRLMLNPEEGVLGTLAAILTLAASGGSPAVLPPEPAAAGSPSTLPLGPSTSSKWNIVCQDQVVPALDAICEFYQRDHASAVPLLLARARSLVGLDFLEIAKELVGLEVKVPTPILSIPPKGASPASLPRPSDGAALSPPFPGIADASELSAAIEGISAYFQKHEPSSPIPLLLARAQRLVGANFRDAVAEILGAESLKKLDETVIGTKSKKN